MAAPIVAVDAVQDESDWGLLAATTTVPAQRRRRWKRVAGLVCTAAVGAVLLTWRINGERQSDPSRPAAAIKEDALPVPASADEEDLFGKAAQIRLTEENGTVQRCLTADSNEEGPPGARASLEKCSDAESLSRTMKQTFRLTKSGQLEWATLPELCLSMEDSKVSFEQCSKGPAAHFLLMGQGSHRTVAWALDLSKCIVGIGSRLALQDCKRPGAKRHFEIMIRQPATGAAVEVYHADDDAERETAESPSGSWLDALGGVLLSVISPQRKLLQDMHTTTPFPTVQS